MGKKNKQNKRRRTDEVDIVLDANGLIPNGFTIDFDDNFGGSSRPKSSRNIAGSDEEDEDSTQQAPRGGHGSQVLPFAMKLPEDHSGEPNDGHEYLYFVRREAAAHPRIKTAEALIRRVDEEVVMEASTSSVPIHRPSSEWRSSFLSRFSNMRQVLATSSAQPGLSAAPPHYLPIPSAQDESSWRTYINGRKGKGRAVKDGDDSAQIATPTSATTATSDVASTSQDVTDTSAHTSPNGDAAMTAETDGAVLPASPAKVLRTEPRPPIPALMRALDHYTTITLLEHIQMWLSDRLEEVSNASTPSTLFLPNSMTRRKKKPIASSTTSTAIEQVTTPIATPPVREPMIPTTPLILTPLESQWIFSLLTVLDPLLISGEISILRGLARTCLDIADFTWTEQQKWLGKGARSSDLDKYSESIGGCWMTIAVIWEIWGQRDLWE